MKNKTITILVIIGLLLTACSHKGDIKNAIPSSSIDPATAAMSSKLSFPLSVNLVFKPLQMEQLKEGKPDTDWELIKEIPFGEVKQQKVGLNIYKETHRADDSNSYLHALIRFQDKYFSIYDFISPGFMESPTNEHSAMFLLQHTFTDQDNQLVLLGGIELFANGPGRVAYIIYDSKNNQWLTFEDWGKPRIIDLDSDGIDEFVIQFEGLHLQFPDVTIFTWNKGIIEVSRSIKAAVIGSDMGNYAILGDDKKISIGENNAENAEAQYIYDKGKLVVETAEADILKRNFEEIVEPVSGWQKSLFKVINDSETIYSEDKMDGTASRLASYNWDTKQSAVIWEGQAKIISIELVPDQEDVQELHFATLASDIIRRFKFSKGEVQELTDEPTSNGYNRKLWFPDGERYLYLHETGKTLGNGAGPEKVPAIYDVKHKKATILPFEKGFWSGLQWMKPGETILASTGYDDIVQVKILNVKELSEFMILNTDKIGDTHTANNPSRHQVLIATEGKVQLYTDHAEQIDVQHQLDYSHEKFTTAFYSFSPDGNKLVYTQGSGSGSKVFIADGDATNPKTITNDELGILHLEWTPTSSHLIAAVQLPNAAEVYMGRIAIAKENT